MLGFNLISEMTKEQIIAELISAQREFLSAMDIDSLKTTLINVRVDAYKKAQIKEARMRQTGDSIFGTILEPDD